MFERFLCRSPVTRGEISYLPHMDQQKDILTSVDPLSPEAKSPTMGIEPHLDECDCSVDPLSPEAKSPTLNCTKSDELGWFFGVSPVYAVAVHAVNLLFEKPSKIAPLDISCGFVKER